MANKDRPLDGRSALVTGASRGIGLACARALHAAGATVVLVARGADALRAVANSLGDRAFAVPGDLADRASVERTIDETRSLVEDGPDILVNNAGRFFLAPVETTSVDAFAETLQVNLVSQFAFASAFVRGMRARGRGHVVTVGSIADQVAFAENSAYAASKFGARGLHGVLRMELRGSGVRATLVSPGPVDTPLWDAVQAEKREGHTPRELMLSATAVAEAVLFAVTRDPSTNIDEIRLSRS